LSKKDKNNLVAKKNNSRKRTKKSKSGKRGGILGFFYAIADFIARLFRTGLIGFIFADLYDKINKMWRNGFIYRFLRKKNKKAHTHSSIVHLYEQSRTSVNVAGFSKNIIHSKLSIWGSRFFLFAFATCIVSAIKKYYIGTEENIFFINLEPLFKTATEETKIWVSIIIMLFSLPLLFSKKELGETLLSHKLTRFIITDVLNLNAHNFKRGTVPSEGSYFTTILLSFSLGLCTFFIDAMVIINIVILLLTISLCMSFPELGILTLLASIPFATVLAHPNTFLVSLVIFTICGFVFKFIRGKRVMRFEFIDVFVLALGLLLIFGGVFNASESSMLKPADIYFAFLCIYFLIVNMYIRKPGIYRGVKVLLVTGFLLGFVGIIDFVLTLGIFKFSWLQSAPALYVIGRIGAMVGDFNALGVFLVMIYPIALAQMLVTRNRFYKLLYFISVVTIVVSATMTLERTVCIGLIVATVTFMLIYNFRSIWLVLGGAGAVWASFALLPANITAPIKDIFVISSEEAAHKLNVWTRVGDMISDNFFTGIGVGEGAFKKVFYQSVLEDGTVVNAGNLFLQILVELGIIGLIVFCLLLFAFAQKCFINTKSKNKKSRSRTLICAGYASIVSGCVMGLNEYVWINYRTFLIFWIVLALTVAVTKVNEREYESEIIYNNMRSVDIEIG
jgi:O-antigen ligase